MSYFDDQEEAWFNRGCKGDISDIDPYEMTDDEIFYICGKCGDAVSESSTNYEQFCSQEGKPCPSKTS